MPAVSATTHIWTKWTGSVWEWFISEWRIPRPALIRWARPG